jgi:heterodisulfide reductase subunit C
VSAFPAVCGGVSGQKYKFLWDRRILAACREVLQLLKKDVRVQEGLTACINCGNCNAICPEAHFYNYDPRMIVETVQRSNETDIPD